MISPKTIEIVKQSAPVLGEHAEDLTRLFYKRMFEGNPEVKPFFNAAHQHSGGQQRALAGAIVAYATHIDKLEALGPTAELIAHKHASLGVKAEHYPIVGKHLLAAIKELLGDAATDELIDAWAEAYGFLAELLIAREAQLYDHHENHHGWTGFRPFRVIKKIIESDEITSVYMEPVDGGPVGEHLPGQYITIRLSNPGGEHGETTMRNYSVSIGPNRQQLRISVKRESAGQAGAPDGFASNTIHDQIDVNDEVEIGPPCGEFVLDVNDPAKRPLVLLSGGVGITPLLSMLHAAVDHKLDRDIVFIHAARHGGVHAFGQEVRSLAKGHGRTKVHVRYSDPTDSDRRESRFDSEGLVDRALLESLLPDSNADFYFCGPGPFMMAVANILRDWGVPESQVRYESFGPKLSLVASGDSA